nr:hypothetical protein [Acinetobacter rathckeae]
MVWLIRSCSSASVKTLSPLSRATVFPIAAKSTSPNALGMVEPSISLKTRCFGFSIMSCVFPEIALKELDSLMSLACSKSLNARAVFAASLGIATVAELGS